MSKASGAIDRLWLGKEIEKVWDFLGILLPQRGMYLKWQSLPTLMRKDFHQWTKRRKVKSDISISVISIYKSSATKTEDEEEN